MPQHLNQQQLDSINALSAEQRYDEFVDKIIKWDAVCGLCSAQGWAVISDDADEFLPVWYHADLAAQWATGGYSDCQPKTIPLNDWLEKWLPGMDSDNIMIVVCPDIEGEGIVVSAAELREDLQRATNQQP